MKLSVGIPLYNKAPYLEPILKTLRMDDAVDELLVFNNSSTDISREDLEDLCRRYDAKVIHTPVLISIDESWSATLRLLTGDIVKLQMADDPVVSGSARIGKAFLTEHSDVDFIMGHTQPLNEDSPIDSKQGLEDATRYYTIVNRSREEVLSIADPQKRINALVSLMHDHCNPFGDVNTLFMRKHCVEAAWKNIRHLQPASYSYPDIELILRLLTKYRGAFVREVQGTFSYRKVSPCTIGQTNKIYHQDAYRTGDIVLSTIILTDSAFEPLRMSDGKRGGLKIFLRLLRLVFVEYDVLQVMPSSKKRKLILKTLNFWAIVTPVLLLCSLLGVIPCPWGLLLVVTLSLCCTFLILRTLCKRFFTPVASS